MTNNAASFVGNIPHHYDGDLGPVIFVDYERVRIVAVQF